LTARKSAAPAAGSPEEAANAVIDGDIRETIITSLQAMTAAAPAAAPPAVPQTDLTDYNSVEAYIDQRKNAVPDIAFETIRRELAAMVRQAKSADPNSPIQLRPATIAEELWYYRQVGGQTADTLRHDLKALEKIPVFLADETDPCRLDAKWRAMELPFIMAVRNRHITEEDLKTALMSRMQGNAEQFLLAQPNIANISFDAIMTLCRARFYVTENQAAARTKNTYQLDKEAVQVYAERLQVASLQLLPTRPSQLKGLVLRNMPESPDGLAALPIPNPFQQEDDLRYDQEVKTIGRTLITDFVKGLKASIRQKMHAARLDQLSFQEVVAAAVREERFAADFPENPQRSAYALKETTEDDQTFATRTTGCYQCNDPNHWIKDCPHLKGANSSRKGGGNTPARGRIWSEKNYNFNRDNKSQPTANNSNKFSRGRGNRGFPHNKGSRERGSFKGNWRNLPRSFRNKNRRKWMIATRAALNKRLRYRQRVYNLTEEENEAEVTYTEEEEELFQLEAEAEHDPDWHQQYINDVAAFEDKEDGESKNA
jgi:hypothetical protein